MSKVRDRTEDFKDVAHRSALSLGYDEVVNSISEKYFPKPSRILRRRREVTIFVKSCKEQIDVLRNSINEEDANSKGWLGMKGDNLNADTVAHKHVMLHTIWF